MTITTVTEGSALTVRLSGRLDTITAPELENELNGHPDTKRLTLDLNGLEYISSAGLRVLLGAQKHLGDPDCMHIINVSASIMEVFDMTGFTTMMNIAAK